MRSESINYETLSRITDAISSRLELEDLSEHIVHSLTEVLKIKGCTLMLLDRKSNELKVAAATGLSQTYLEKGPLSAQKSIAESLTNGPVAIYDVEDDPRLQYPEEAKKEGIKSILSIPVILRGKPLGALRFYTAEQWEITSHDLVIYQAIAEIIALVIDNLRMQKGMQASIDVLKIMHRASKASKRPSYD